MFQNHSLLPWLTVYDNVGIAVNKVFGGKKSRAERHDWVMHNLDLVQMGHAKDKRPAEISGGMKQRVGLARALSMEPKVLLLDEPFGALDALTRAHLQDSVMAIHAKLGNTVLMITHDVDEAVLLSDRIVMMTNGPAARIGEVLEVPLARPRRRLELAANPIYLKCRQRVLNFLYGVIASSGCVTPSPRKWGKGRKTAAASRRAVDRNDAASDYVNGAMNGEPLVVIGNGMAAARFADELSARALGRYAVAVVGEEPRLALTACCSLRARRRGRIVGDRACRRRGGATWHRALRHRATAIDPQARTVALADGRSLPFSGSAATGSPPIRPQIPAWDCRA